MRIIKKAGRPVTAFPLGQDHPLEAELTARGRLAKRPDGRYEVFTREASGGSGELADPGDYVKLDAGGFPYPNRRAYFLENHTHQQGDTYLQRPVPLPAWQAGQPLTEEMAFALERGLIRISEENAAAYFSAFLWGAQLTAPQDAAVVFYRVDRDAGGGITGLDFNFVVRQEFDAAYDILE